jgi:Ca2+-binding EF-hand superfamily protein
MLLITVCAMNVSSFFRLMRVKEVLDSGFADLYDAFEDMDSDQDGKVSLQDFTQTIANIDGGESLTSGQIDACFQLCGVNADGFIALKDFLKAFAGGKASRSATETGNFSSTAVSRPFEEV